jgi:hypothetical protein
MYVNYMMTLLTNNFKYMAPDYTGEYQLLFTDSSYYLYKATKVFAKGIKKDSMNIFLGYKEVNDARLGLTLRIHRWTCGCEVSLPNTMFYLSNRKNFEYAFIFKDEARNRRYDDSLTNQALPDGPPRLDFQLNLLANKLRINTADKKESLKHFLSLFTDSLLALKPVTGQDVNTIMSEWKKYDEVLNEAGPCKCAEDIDKEMQQMTDELKSGNKDILYYRSSSKYYKGYWRFEFIDRGRILIKADFNKCTCGIPKYE